SQPRPTRRGFFLPIFPPGRRRTARRPAHAQASPNLYRIRLVQAKFAGILCPESRVAGAIGTGIDRQSRRRARTQPFASGEIRMKTITAIALAAGLATAASAEVITSWVNFGQTGDQFSSP